MKKILICGGHFLVCIWFVVTASCVGCNSDNEEEPDNGVRITGVSIPSVIDVVVNGEVTLDGKGFEATDKIRLTSTTDQSKTFMCNLASVTPGSFTITMPDGLVTGKYKLTVVRGDIMLDLGATTLNVTVSGLIPDKDGMTIKGIVYSNGVGIPGVVVSDGYEVTVTDKDGIYYLASEKKNGHVFISVPGNYEVTSNINAPQFFRKVAGGAVEQKDFSLIPVNNDRHVVVAMADLHLANRNNDIDQFGNGFLPDINNLIKEYTDQGLKVYGLTLGDLTWDQYWYDNKFLLTDYLTWMNKINSPVFNVMGNHDNDPYCPGDWLAEQAYRNIIGPTYYSFNLGKVHYVVLDNTEYKNDGASEGVIGSRDYNSVISTNQIDWLKKDLAALADKSTPVVIAMHIPLYKAPGLDGKYNINLTRGQEFLDCLTGFSNVHILSGHVHVNYSAGVSGQLMEHNIGAVCATWWWTGRNGYANNHICKDGSVGGYAVWEFNQNDPKWYYKSIGYDKNYQFRAYDLNTVHITAQKFAPASTDQALAVYAGNYASPNLNNEVLINIWGYDPEWKIEVTEKGVPLEVKRVSELDPLHIISYEAKRLNVNATPTSSFVTTTTSHMFKVTATEQASTLDIKVTDRFGNVYNEVMERPKEFNYGMK